MSVALIEAYTVECRRCGEPITTRARPGNTIRCPACGYAQRTAAAQPGAAAVIPLPRAAAAVWDPPSPPRRACESTEPCPDCGKPLLAGPRGTWRACGHCLCAVTPAAVAAPYERGQAGAQRQVVSQRERDLAAIALAQRKGIMLGQLGRLADDDRLADESRPVVEWFASEVKAAGTGDRLDELAALLPDAGIRHWWQGQPVTGADGWDDGDGQDQDGEDQGEDGGYPRAITAAPAAAVAAPHEMTAADALDALGWRLSPTPGACQVVKGQTPCGAETRHHITGRWVRDAWVCNPCYQAVCKVIRDAERSA